MLARNLEKQRGVHNIFIAHPETWYMLLTGIHRGFFRRHRQAAHVDCGVPAFTTFSTQMADMPQNEAWKIDKAKASNLPL